MIKSFFIAANIIISPVFIPVTGYSKPPIEFKADKPLLEYVAQDDLPTIIYFGEDWCHYCQVSKKFLNQAAIDYDGKLKIIFVTLTPETRGDEYVKDVSAQFDAIPFFVVIKKNSLSYMGHVNNLNELIDRALKE